MSRFLKGERTQAIKQASGEIEMIVNVKSLRNAAVTWYMEVRKSVDWNDGFCGCRLEDGKIAAVECISGDE